MKKKNKLLITAFPFFPVIKHYQKLIGKKNIAFDIIKTNQHLYEKDFLKIIHKYDALLCGDDQVTQKVLDKASKLKVISKWGTGIDSIDVNYAKKKGIKVFNTPGAFTNGVSTLALTMLLSFFRKIIQNHNDIKKNKWKKYSGETLDGKKIGIIGIGNIGKRIVEMLEGFKTINYGNDIKVINKSFLNKHKLKMRTKDYIYKNCEIIIFANNLSKSSFKLINFESIKKLKKKPLIINIGRGGTIDNKALIEALKKKKIRGACLDVFEKEPLEKKSLFKKFENCIFTSHNAFNTIDEVEFVHKNTLRNIFKGLKL